MRSMPSLQAFLKVSVAKSIYALGFDIPVTATRTVRMLFVRIWLGLHWDYFIFLLSIFKVQ